MIGGAEELRDPERIACFHLNQLGDLLFSLPALYALRQRFTVAHITSVARPAHRDILLLSGLADEVLERPYHPLSAKISLALNLRKRRLDLAVLFSTSAESAILAGLARPREKAGFQGRGLAYRAEKIGAPSIANNLRLVEALGCFVEKKDYTRLVKLGDAERGRARNLLFSSGLPKITSYAVLAPGASGKRGVKEWTDEGFARVADHLAEDLGIVPVLVGTANESRIGTLSHSIVDLSGRTTVVELAALLEGAQAFVGIDSGVMHLAAAVATPVVALFGPTDPAQTGPSGDGHIVVTAGTSCSACMKHKCSDPVCMREITPERVIEAVAACLEGARTTDGRSHT
jgi:ADP-heptose:LPS heptosyltransferase